MPKMLVRVFAVICIASLITGLSSCYFKSTEPVSDIAWYEYSNEVPKTIQYNNQMLPVRHFDISAISAKIVYNDYGDNDPNGLMYVLTDEKEKIREAIQENPNKSSDLVMGFRPNTSLLSHETPSIYGGRLHFYSLYV